MFNLWLNFLNTKNTERHREKIFNKKIKPQRVQRAQRNKISKRIGRIGRIFNMVFKLSRIL